MPVRFTCRLMAVRTESGKIRVRYGYLGDDCLQFLTIHGPEMVVPPAEEMTEDEFERWQFDLAAGTGFSFEYVTTSVNAPLVEAARTIEDEIPPDSVTAELLWALNGQGGRTMAVQVTNGWNRPIPEFSVATVCEYEAPQPGNLGDIKSQMLGGSESFIPMQGKVGDDLWPRLPLGFYLDPRILTWLRSRAAALSPESHWLSLRTAGHEFGRVDGGRVAEFLMNDEGE